MSLVLESITLPNTSIYKIIVRTNCFLEISKTRYTSALLSIHLGSLTPAENYLHQQTKNRWKQFSYLLIMRIHDMDSIWSYLKDKLNLYNYYKYKF